ncbi:hypothetical protein [Sphingosinicella sp. BN140058]|uniref:hypothetical protein n=1 Tax=Sphingosinicella sp. BN140058 TaxID=1892855 RepID=UPI001011F35C|nr:hypothetical protein [Sphingosinicella sp. BN140058]QAY77061.1 hypothetical protein ETR14_11550 [Sphingosinicella sp. BN140058]
MDWHAVKQWLETTSGLDMDALHVHAGILCQVFVALVLRRRLSSPWPWLVTAAVILANEYYDYHYEIWPQRDMQWAESVKDVWNTLLIPTLLLLLTRFVPGLFRKAPSETASAADPGQAGTDTGEARKLAQQLH